jgi:hypothetical protein
MDTTITFRNGVFIEGDLISNSNNEIVIEDPDTNITTHIPNVSDSVLFYTVNSTTKDFETLASKSDKSNEDLKQLASLKGKMNDIEMARIRNSLTPPSALLQKVPDVFEHTKRQSSTEHPTKKTPRQDIGFGAELQNLFNKKH